MTRIVTTHYRYKRPPRKRKAVPLEGPAIVTSVEPKKGRRPVGGAAAEGGEPAPAARAGDIQSSTAPERRRDPAVTTAGKAPTTTANRASRHRD